MTKRAGRSTLPYKDYLKDGGSKNPPPFPPEIDFEIKQDFSFDLKEIYEQSKENSGQA